MAIPIIVVDDSEGDRFLLAHCIESSGIDCTIHNFEAGDYFLDEFTNPEKYPALIGNDQPPVLIFLDINMPRLTGFDVLEALEAAEDTPDYFVVMMLTSSDHEDDRANAVKHSVVKDYTVKPLTVEAFKQLVAKHYS